MGCWTIAVSAEDIARSARGSARRNPIAFAVSRATGVGGTHRGLVEADETGIRIDREDGTQVERHELDGRVRTWFLAWLAGEDVEPIEFVLGAA